MTDEAQHLVWQTDTDPWGAPIIRAAANDARFTNTATLNLRLPGQYFDAETGLHDNVYRTYNPNTGRYLQPDPLGYPDGPDPYLYASGDPVNKMDPLGLYEIDTHYYMTYFLAVAAGMSEDDALLLALAAQYVDDNDNTRPLSSTGGLNGHLTRLLSYHFVLTPSSVDPGTGLLDPSNYGSPPSSTNVANPSSDQLTRLLNAVTGAMNDPALTPAARPFARMQFFGEYLHAFEDTFGHRDQCNKPIPIYAGFGHGLYGHQPDYTYDTMEGADPSDSIIRYNNWAVRPGRTLAMQQEVFAQIKSQFGTTARIGDADLEAFLKSWNEVKENEGNTDGFTNNPEEGKIDRLNKKLQELGFGNIPDYNVWNACMNRIGNLSGLTQADYPGTILATPSTCPTKRP